jgi:hypothetical protein
MFSRRSGITLFFGVNTLGEILALALLLELASVPEWASARQSFLGGMLGLLDRVVGGRLLCVSLSFRAAKIVAAKALRILSPLAEMGRTGLGPALGRFTLGEIRVFTGLTYGTKLTLRYLN